MTSDTVFLKPITSDSNLYPNFVDATGNAIFLNYSHTPGEALTDAQTDTLLQGGVAVAIAEAEAILFQDDPAFSQLFTNSSGVGTDGAFTGSAKSETKVLASFEVGANQTFTFDFSGYLELIAKEIENPKTEYNQANSQIGFLVLDTTNPDKPKIIDYFGVGGQLISSAKIGNLKFGGSGNFSITNIHQDKDINGDNGKELITGNFLGSYQNTFKNDTHITLVQINSSDVRLAGDTLIGNLGTDVTYGTIWNDYLKGKKNANKIYGSLGNDQIVGNQGNDILEGGQGHDWLFGKDGNDQISGGWDNDVLIGGRGSDVLVGGSGGDKFIFQRFNSFLNGEFDVIKDFEVGSDRLIFQGFCQHIQSGQWLSEMFSLGNIKDTENGVLFSFNTGRQQGQLLLEGLTFNSISPESIVLV